MQVPFQFQTKSVSEIFTVALQKGYLNDSHRSQLQQALLNPTVQLEERALIDRILYAVRRGWLEITQ